MREGFTVDGWPIGQHTQDPLAKLLTRPAELLARRDTKPLRILRARQPGAITVSKSCFAQLTITLPPIASN